MNKDTKEPLLPISDVSENESIGTINKEFEKIKLGFKSISDY